MKFFNLELCGLARKDIQYRDPVKNSGCTAWIFTNGNGVYECGTNANPNIDAIMYTTESCAKNNQTTYKSNCQTTK
jgi:hypothetical protein